MSWWALGLSFGAGIVSSLAAQGLWTVGNPWLKRRRRRQTIHHLAKQGLQSLTDSGFLKIGHTVVPWVVCAMGPWTPNRIICRYYSKPVAFPPPIKQRIREVSDDMARRARLGNHVPFNGLGYQLESFDVSSRTIPEEQPLLKLTFRPTEYFAMLATDHALDHPIVIHGQETTLRQEYAHNVDLRIRPVPVFATHFGIALQVITRDGLTLISERGATAVDAHVFFPSVAEGSSRPIDANDRHIPHPSRTAIRGLMEELAIEVDMDAINWVSFGANAVLCEYGLIGWVEVPVTWPDIEHRRQVGLPKDTWESAQLHAVPFNPQALAEFVRHHGPWSPFALVTLYHVLIAHFRWSDVDAAWRDIHPALSEYPPESPMAMTTPQA